MSLFDMRPQHPNAYGQLVDAEPAKPSPVIEDAHKIDRKAEKAKHSSQKADLLAALRKGPLTNNEIIGIAQHVSGRVYDLRKDGYVIRTKYISSGVFLYTLEREPNASGASTQSRDSHHTPESPDRRSSQSEALPVPQVAQPKSSILPTREAAQQSAYDLTTGAGEPFSLPR